MQCLPQRQNDEWFCATCNARWSNDDKPSRCILKPPIETPTVPSRFTLRMELALTINGPHDATHIGTARLRELQTVRWQRQTTDAAKAAAWRTAGAVIEVLRERGYQVPHDKD